MKLTYDPKYNLAYLHLKDKGSEVETIRVSDEMNVDIAPDGTVYGIEFLDANRQLSADQLGKLIVVNEESGETAEIKLSA
ncbi:MAG: DUF2283 domain-containing protein [Planctomycetes bacterium]|nr:DUF2283 domain-containing protein [Planctomycetota bacterium]